MNLALEGTLELPKVKWIGLSREKVSSGPKMGMRKIEGGS